MAEIHQKLRNWHLYFSMGVGVLVIAVAVTGVLLNHGAKLGLDDASTAKTQASVPADLLKSPEAAALVPAVRRVTGATGVADPLEVDDDVVRVVFRSPGRVTTAKVQRSGGSMDVEAESRGTLGVLADLHRGKHSSAAWRIMMDVLAALLAASAVTGIILALALPNRRKVALALLILGTAVGVAVYVLAVP
jgi:uncharacterized protein